MKFKLVYIVHLVILIITGCVYFLAIHRLINFLKLGGFDGYDYYGAVYLIQRTKLLFTVILITFPFIGIFFKNKYGWIFISFYFYFTIWNVVFQFCKEGLDDLESILLKMFFISIFGLLEVIMNTKRVSLFYYKTDKDKLLGFNIISFAIGTCASLFFTV
ncbi:hypothetical protein ACFSKN_02805 [Mariniflexile gromovii]|uniref:Uncharacterized protein n=1 Tax=Mariniflexile gromovii TaxID=362523 RepID=A0ABS4BPL8_9FLAO|nr:hypothetical protein [Mariniflexile gromovii]MBP0902535.1 hypothetical protein [Mariniflexile gromovii]